MAALEAIYREAHAELAARNGHRVDPREFRVDFHPYAGLRSTIFERRTHYEVRLGDLLRTAPLKVHDQLARLLLGRIDRRLRVRPEEFRDYRAWARSPEVLERHEALRRSRGRKSMLPPEGRFHDLRTLYHRLNREYFSGLLVPPRLGWSPGKSRRLFGHQDAAHDAIVINRMLDSPRVPEQVVASVLFHEMLHQKHGIRYAPGGRRVVHPPALRAEEQSFRHYVEAKRFLDSVAARRIRL